MLTVRDLRVRYGSIEAVRGVSLEVHPGEIVSLIGSNGAGKSSTIRAIMGLERTAGGEVHFLGQNITGLPTVSVVRTGLVLVPEGRRVFRKMTVAENIEMGGFLVRDKSVVSRRLEELLDLFPVLRTRRNQSAATLSGGEQQMLALARGLMAAPQLIIMDEPSLGLAPILVERVFSILKEISARGTTILLVEQKAYLAMKLSHRAYVMETGSIVCRGTTEDLLHDDFVVNTYLGAQR